MTERQNFLLELYREFGDKAQNALDFINNNDGENRIVSAENHKTCQIEAIDLGLPSGRLWANMNLGANAPEETGLYYSWGNVEGHIAGGDYDFDE